MKLLVSTLVLVSVFVMALADSPKADPKEEAKVARAKITIAQLDKGAELYYVKHGKYPESLKALTEGNPPFIEAKALTDPWDKPYKYDREGKNHKGKKPDIWTETPDKQTLGNWPAEKK